MRQGTETRFCGNCKHGLYEDVYGWMFCDRLKKMVFCGDLCDVDPNTNKDYYEPIKQKEHESKN